MSRRHAARALQEAVEREILELLDKHGEMTTWQVQAKVKTGRRVLASNDRVTIYDRWSTSYIRERLYELSPRVTRRAAGWGPGWDGRPAGVRQFLWRLQDPERLEQMRVELRLELQALHDRVALLRRDQGIGDAPSESD
ncbi:hypothetical protein ACGFIY_29715 [Micromonospora chersina]|uniref:hypothetical protein n=1 Tax=Micromonospora chersina TaxID=47854 RepID=UPI00371F72E7